MATAYFNDQPDGSGNASIMVIEYGGSYGIGGLDAIPVGDGIGVFHYNAEGGRLYFLRDFTPGDVVDPAAKTGRNVSAALINGLPAASYYDAINQDLKFALNDQPDGSGTWNISVVETDDSVTSYSGLTSVACGTQRCPAVFYGRGSGEVWFAINDQPDGSGSWTRTQVLPGTVTLHKLRPISAAVINGLPAVLVSSATGDSLTFIINESPDGTGSWNWNDFSSTATNYRLLEVDGRPAMVYMDPDLGGIVFEINDQPDGTGTFTGQIIHAGSASRLDFALVGNRPAVAFWDNDNQVLMFIIANTPDGSGTWHSVVASNPNLSFTPANLSLAVADSDQPEILVASSKSGNLDVVSTTTR